MNQLNNLYSKIHTPENLIASWKLVKKNKGAGGVDRITMSKVESRIEEVLMKVKEELEEERYKVFPLRRIYIPKTNGKQRALGIPTIRDRIVQQAIRRVIEPHIDAKFEDFSYGFRPGKSAKQALHHVEERLESGLRWIIQIDLERFFDTIPHETIMIKLREEISDKRVINLIGRFLKSGAMEEGKMRQTTTGTPQGGVISPLLANLVLDEVDKYVTSHGAEAMIRYADDFVILCKTRRRAVHVYKEVIEVLKRLGLKVNEEKSRINHISERFVFLGYEFGGSVYYKGEGGTKISDMWKRPSEKAIKALKEKLRYLTKRLQPRNIEMLKEKLNPVMRGWFNYFREGRNKRRFEELDSWYRMRLRSFLHKKKSYLDNYKYPNSYFRKLGYIFLSDVYMIPHDERIKPRQQAMRV